MNSETALSRINKFQQRVNKSLKGRKKATAALDVENRENVPVNVNQSSTSSSPNSKNTNRKRKRSDSEMTHPEKKQSKKSKGNESTSSSTSSSPPVSRQSIHTTKTPNGSNEMQLLIEEFKKNPASAEKAVGVIKRGKSKDAVLERFRRNAKQKRVEKQTKSRNKKGIIMKPLNEAKKEALAQSTSQLEVVRKFQATLMGKYKCSGNVSVRQRPITNKKSGGNSNSCGPQICAINTVGAAAGSESAVLSHAGASSKMASSANQHIVTSTETSFDVIDISPPKPKSAASAPKSKKHKMRHIVDESDDSEDAPVNSSSHATEIPSPLVCNEKDDVSALGTPMQTPIPTSSAIPKEESPKVSPEPEFSRWKQLSQTNYLIQKYQKIKKATTEASNIVLTEEVQAFREILVHLLESSEQIILTLERHFDTHQESADHERAMQNKVASLADKLSKASDLWCPAASDNSSHRFFSPLSESRDSPHLFEPSCQRQLFPKIGSPRLPQGEKSAPCGIMPHFGHAIPSFHDLFSSSGMGMLDLMWNRE